MSKERAKAKKEITGIIFNIQRFSIHDGPGIRTTIFFKGCPLRCFWCHNPEGLNSLPELQYWPHRCVLCHTCVDACPQHLHRLEPDDHRIEREHCLACFRCVATCYSGALEASGRRISVTEVMNQVLADQPFYETSGGGVTLSGGEPLRQPLFCLRLLQASKSAGLHTTVDTCAETAWSHLAAVLPFVDLFLIDLKILDPQLHKKYTGKSNERILNNIRRLVATNASLQFRIPVIPGVNDTADTIHEIVRFIDDLRTPRLSVELVPFHRLAVEKYHSLGLNYRAAALPSLPAEHLDQLRACIQL